MEQQPDIFEPRINETGKTYLRKFARIGYIIFVLITLTSLYQIYLWVKNIMVMQNANEEIQWSAWEYFKPYLNVAILLSVIISNWHYTQFPVRLGKAVQDVDEIKINDSFRFLYRGALIFLVYLIVSTITTIEYMLME